MRVISSDELDLVSGGSTPEKQSKSAKTGTDGGFWGSIGDFVSGLFGGSSGSSSSSCVASSSSNGRTTITQTCGAGGVSTVTTAGPGYFSQATTTPNHGGSIGITYGAGNFRGNTPSGYAVTTTNCIGGKCTTTTSPH